jgi:hypothetical protein
MLQAGVSLVTVRYGVRAANSMSNKGLTKVMAVALALIAPVIAFKPTPKPSTEDGEDGEGAAPTPAEIPAWLDALPVSQRIKDDAMEGT